MPKFPSYPPYAHPATRHPCSLVIPPRCIRPGRNWLPSYPPRRIHIDTAGVIFASDVDVLPRGRSLRSPCHTPKADGYSLRHDKRPHLLGGGAPKIRVSTVLLKMLAALCMLNSAGAMTTPPPPSTPPYGRLECGKPGACNENAGLRNPNELHEVRACNASSLTFRALSMLTATPIRGHRCGAAPTSSSLQPGEPLGLAAPCGGSQMRAGHAHATRPSPRPRPSANP